MTFCFKCPRCGTKTEFKYRIVVALCERCGEEGHEVGLTRDWRSEAVAVDRFRSFGDGKVHAEYVNQTPEGDA